MEKAIRFELRSGCQELNAKTQGCKAAKKSLLQRSGSPAEIRLFGSRSPAEIRLFGFSPEGGTSLPVCVSHRSDP
jgi:hypothetical protein